MIKPKDFVQTVTHYNFSICILMGDEKKSTVDYFSANYHIQKLGCYVTWYAAIIRAL